jgi:hypothetical protein
MKLIRSKRLLKVKVFFSKLIKTFEFKTLLTSFKQTVCEKIFANYYSFDTKVIFRIKNFSHTLIYLVFCFESHCYLSYNTSFLKTESLEKIVAFILILIIMI